MALMTPFSSIPEDRQQSVALQVDALVVRPKFGVPLPGPVEVPTQPFEDVVRRVENRLPEPSTIGVVTIGGSPVRSGRWP